MVSTAREGAGGIASVISTYAACGLFERWPILTLDSHVTGSASRKLIVFAGALTHFVGKLLRGRIGLLHVHAASGSSFWRKSCFVCVAFLFRKPVLLHIHGGNFMSFYEDSYGPIRRRMVRYILEHSTRVITLSPIWRGRLLTIAPRATIVNIPNPVMVASGKPRKLRCRVVLFLGRISAEKGVFDLIKAWKQVSAAVGGWLVLAGDGDLDTARSEIVRLGLSDSVELPGWISGVAKDELFARADVCVLPSYFEGMPMSLLEAFGSGIPCAASAVGGIPDIMSDGVEGRLIKPGDIQALADVLIQMLSDKEQYARMSQAALARFHSDFAANVVIPKLEKLYREIGMNPVRADINI